jgi:hypothetical protein
VTLIISEVQGHWGDDDVDDDDDDQYRPSQLSWWWNDEIIASWAYSNIYNK